MPIYEYECQNCGYIHEAMYGMNKEPKTLKLEHNNALKQLEEKVEEPCDGLLKKIISQSTFELKGRGWYKDGYSKPKSTKTPKK
ncbi:MAG: zinc ribbon domain-containing protein [Nanoarchaeota archaeon]|nr:zinc ribbon domain-containing protein [Nanoarchaeota archaeon]